ncbi:MAG: hypothetical protein QXG76_00365 [Candidatus Bathyarchaeia archaeon]
MPENITTLARYGGGYYLLKRDGATCDGCGENFERPILATIVSGSSSRTYYACPRCLTKVGDVKPARHDRSEEEGKASTVVVRKKGESESEGAKCEHFLGYLKKRPKNTPIPDECLTCSRMIECLAY